MVLRAEPRVFRFLENALDFVLLVTDSASFIPHKGRTKAAQRPHKAHEVVAKFGGNVRPEAGTVARVEEV